MFLNNLSLGALLLRLGVGGMMLFHGIDKLFHLSHTMAAVESLGLPGFIGLGVYLGEILAPIMLIIGFKVRIAAALVIITMLTAIAVTTRFDVWALGAHGAWIIELQMLYIVPCLVLLIIGGGRYGLSRQS